MGRHRASSRESGEENSVHKRKREETQKIKEQHRTAQLLRFSGKQRPGVDRKWRPQMPPLGKNQSEGTSPQACSFPFSSAAAREASLPGQKQSAKGPSRLSAYF